MTRGRMTKLEELINKQLDKFSHRLDSIEKHREKYCISDNEFYDKRQKLRYKYVIVIASLVKAHCLREIEKHGYGTPEPYKVLLSNVRNVLGEKK